jgi:hypothetical protein
LGDAGQVGNHGFDSVSLPFNLGDDALHLVAVEGIGDILRALAGAFDAGQTYPTNVDERHVGQTLTNG